MAKFHEIFKNTYFEEYLRPTASNLSKMRLTNISRFVFYEHI